MIKMRHTSLKSVPIRFYDTLIATDEIIGNENLKKTYKISAYPSPFTNALCTSRGILVLSNDILQIHL